MKILLLSDNHGNYDTVSEILEREHSQVDLVLHCGDSEFAPNDPIWKRVDGVVKGNLDFYNEYPIDLTFETEYGNIFLTHGHRYQVGLGNELILHEASQSDATMIFHGHMHVSYAQYTNGILLVNPGSISRPRSNHMHKTYAIVSLESERIEVIFYNLDGVEISELGENFIVE